MGHAKKNLHLFEELCGREGMKLVTLLTTMWDTAGEKRPNTIADFEAREESLIQNYWSEMIKDGAEPRRSWNTRDSLLPILDQAIARRRQLRENKESPRGLLLQEELIEKKQLWKTRAGSVLAEEFKMKGERLKRHHKRLLKELKKDPNNRRLVRRIREIEGEVHENEEGAEKLNNWSVKGIGIAIIIAFLTILGFVLRG
jgi:hypothetical protein